MAIPPLYKPCLKVVFHCFHDFRGFFKLGGLANQKMRSRPAGPRVKNLVRLFYAFFCFPGPFWSRFPAVPRPIDDLGRNRVLHSGENRFSRGSGADFRPIFGPIEVCAGLQSGPVWTTIGTPKSIENGPRWQSKCLPIAILATKSSRNGSRWQSERQCAIEIGVSCTQRAVDLRLVRHSCTNDAPSCAEWLQE